MAMLLPLLHLAHSSRYVVPQLKNKISESNSKHLFIYSHLLGDSKKL